MSNKFQDIPNKFIEVRNEFKVVLNKFLAVRNEFQGVLNKFLLVRDKFQEVTDKITAVPDKLKARTGTRDKMRALLSAFPHGRVLVLLANFESKLNPKTRDMADAELDEALQALLDFQHHSVNDIINTRIAPRNLSLMQPGPQYTLNLDEGLELPYAENILREMDKDGKLDLAEAPADLLELARQRTLGFPPALEALVIAREIGARREESYMLTIIGDVLVDQDKFDEALQHFSESIQIADEIGGVQEQNEARYGLALCEKKLLHVEEAIKTYQAARAINKDAGYVKRVLRLFHELAKEDKEGMLLKVRSAISIQDSVS